MPKGKIERDGEITITYNPSKGDSLIVAGHRVLPCDGCGEVQAFPLDGPCVAAFWCEACSTAGESGHHPEVPLHRCAGKSCPGLPWKASEQGHPYSCNGYPGTLDETVC